MTSSLHTLPLAAISDALDLLGIAGQIAGIKPLSAAFRIAGPCFTIDYLPVEQRPGGTVGDYLESVPQGHVVLIANQGRLDCTVWGDLLTLAAKKRGLAGTVIDGVCRDSDSSHESAYPLFSRGTYMRTGKGRVALSAVQKPVAVSGIVVNPGDILVGGAEGVLAVPAKSEAEVVRLAEEIEAAENKIREIVRHGGSLTEARKKFRYHAIGRKP